jgi:two-component system nitrogen regulation response regulator GlnG
MIKDLETNDSTRRAESALYKSVIQSIEKPLIENTLERTAGNQLKASKILGINRNTMRSKIRKLGIDTKRWKA